MDKLNDKSIHDYFQELSRNIVNNIDNIGRQMNINSNVRKKPRKEENYNKNQNNNNSSGLPSTRNTDNSTRKR